ncbi:MAG TPA: sigma-70 family RNA polymerase sigma factor [Terriglobales bacterium]|nr:sigma-70 family RNA polymerase sigma factor [Terriglobales bacterium]
MASTLQNVAVSEFTSFVPTFTHSSVDQYKDIYEQNRHRVYALAFWMTNNELQAEQLLEATFVRAFAESRIPNEEQIDEALVAELRDEHIIGLLTLNCAEATQIEAVRHNTKRVHLELAVVQLPATEKLMFLLHDVEGYSHERIARLLNVTEKNSQLGLHQARLRIRELVSKMAW